MHVWARRADADVRVRLQPSVLVSTSLTSFRTAGLVGPMSTRRGNPRARRGASHTSGKSRPSCRDPPTRLHPPDGLRFVPAAADEPRHDGTVLL